MPAEPDGPRRVTRRARYQISRSGCRTCKIRRIRCDESKPSCRNCQSTGRKCEGVGEDRFVFVGSRSSSRHRPDRSQTNSPTLALTPPRKPEELRSFNIFFVKAAPLFSTGTLDAGFWRDTIPRVSQSMRFAWDAAISIGLLFENPVHTIKTGSATSTQLQPQQIRALQWYSRSVSGLSQQMMGGDPSDEMLAIVSCSLFTACEFQQGNTASGCALLGRGLNLLAAYLAPDRLASPVSDATFTLEQAVVPFMTRHALSFALVGLPHLYDFTSLATAPKTGTLTARFSEPWYEREAVPEALFDLFYRSHEISRAAMLVLDQPSELHWIAKLHAPLRDALRAWRERLTNLSSTQSTPEDAVNTSYLRLYHIVATVLIETCLSTAQTALDAHLSDFASIVDISVTLLSTAHTPPAPFTLHVAPPLFFTATRCRDPILRRRALTLLQSTPAPTQPQLSLWTALPIRQIAAQVIAFEEASTGAASSATTPPPAPAGIPIPIPEARRVHHIQVTTVARPRALGGGRALALKLVTYTVTTREPRVHLVDLPPQMPQTGGNVSAAAGQAAPAAPDAPGFAPPRLL